MPDPVSRNNDYTHRPRGRRGNGPQRRGEGWRGRGIENGRARFTGSSDRTTYRGRGTRGTRGTRGIRGQTGQSNRPGISQFHSADLRTLSKDVLLGRIDSSRVQSLPRTEDVDLCIEGCEYVASYSWLNESPPAILVPGAPPIWTPPRVPPLLKQDSGEYFRDQNAARWSRYPMEPAIRAIYAQNRDFTAADIDVVCCGNTMGNLIRFLDSSERSFRFSIEIIGGTAFLVRGGSSPMELISDVRGYGHTFPEAYTSWTEDLKGSESHQRLVKYKFGGLCCLFRSESDGYFGEKVNPNQPKSQSGLSKELDLDELTSLESCAESLQVSQKAPTTAKSLIIKIGGQVVPQRALFDLKTRSFRNEIDMEEMYPRLWVSQTPNIIVAYHKAGKFDDIQCRDLVKELKDWETAKQQLVRGLYSTLILLIDMAKQAEGQKIEVRCIGDGHLQIQKMYRSTWSCLPSSLRAQWAGADSEDDSSDSEGADDYLNF